MAIELVTTDGIFALDGGEWEVTNNIWIVGDDRDVVIFDAAHDHQVIAEAVAGRNSDRKAKGSALSGRVTPSGPIISYL